MPEKPDSLGESLQELFTHIANGTFAIERLDADELEGTVESERAQAKASLSAFLAAIDALELEDFPPAIGVRARASYEALLVGDYASARREGGWAGSILEQFMSTRRSRPTG